MERKRSENDSLRAVQQRLQAVIDGLPAAPSALGHTADTLQRRLSEASSGGKQIRPSLLLHAHRLLGGTRDRAALHEAVAYELLHLAFLLHDDVIDRDWTRRDRPTLAARYRDDHAGADADRFGEAAAIVAGDLALHLAHQEHALATALLPEVDAGLLQDAFGRAVYFSAIGELADLSSDTRPVTARRAEAVASAKTTAYTFTGPLHAGAVLATASQEHTATLTRYADAAGLAFQLNDDLDDVLEPPAPTSTSRGSDLINSRPTLLTALADRHPDRAAFLTAAELARHEGDDRDARRWLIDSGCVSACQQRMVALTDEAANAARQLPDRLCTFLMQILEPLTAAGNRT
jgi:geranylgeranyl pyrophosphate synthase